MALEPNDPLYPYDIGLTNGATSIELKMCDRTGKRSILGSFTEDPIEQSSLKFYEGQQKYSDMQPPWTPVAQTDWSGGRGGEDFDKDSTKYYDGNRVDTTLSGQVIPAGQYIYMKGTRTACHNWEYKENMATIYASATYPYFAWQVTPAANITTTANLQFVFRSGVMPTVKIYPDSAGSPDMTGAALATLTTTESLADSVYLYKEYKFTGSLGANTLTASTAYWIVTYWNLTGSNTALIFVNNTTDTTTTKKGTSVPVWSSGTNVPYYQLTAADADFMGITFEYKRALMMVKQYADTDTKSKLFLNGDWGAADASAAGTLVDATKSWTADEWIGCQVYITEGTGYIQEQNWRYISDNDGTSLTVTPNWDVIPDTTTVYVIKGSSKWTEIAVLDTNYNVVITDILPVNGVVYFACGDSALPLRYCAYNNSGTWTETLSGVSGSAAETGDGASGGFTFLDYGVDKDYAPVIWGAKGGFPSTVYKAPAQSWTSGTGSALTFGSAINVGDLYERISGICNYTSPATGISTFTMIKESSLYYMYNDLPTKYDINEMGSTRDSRNGLAHYQKGVYLYFSYHNTMLRYYNGQLDNVGPTLTEYPLPSNRKGNISAIAGTDFALYVAIDGGADGYSSVMAYNGQGYSELFRGAAVGDRIRSLYVESIDGNKPDRLIFSCGSDMVWLPICEDPYNHINGAYDYYMFCYQSTLITSYFYVGLNNVEKFWNSVEMLMKSNFAGSLGNATLWYRKDNTTTWTYLATNLNNFSNETAFSSTYNVSSRRIQLRIAMTLVENTYEATCVLATILEALVRTPTKDVVTVMCRLESDGTSATYTTGLAQYNALKTLEALATPCYITSHYEGLHQKYGFVDHVKKVMIKPAPNTRKTEYIAQFRLVIAS